MLIALLLAVSYGPDAGGLVQVSTRKAEAQWVRIPDCTQDGGNALNFSPLDGGYFYCGVHVTAPTNPGTPTYSVQYNNNSAFGGASQVMIDGGNMVLLGMTGHPPAPGATDHSIIYDYLSTTGMPIRAMHIDNAMGVPMNEGLLNLFSLNGTSSNWRTTGCMPIGFQNTGYSEIGDTTQNGACTNGGSCTVTGPTWASTSLYTRSPVTLATKTAVAGTNVMCGVMYVGNPSVHFWRGDSTGAGGFFWWTRIFIVTKFNDNYSIGKMFAGVMPATGAPSSSVQPSTYDNSCYFGHDTNSGAVANLNFCCGTSTATCQNLGDDFPTVSGAWYDLYIWAPPHGMGPGGNDYVYGAAVRLDTAKNSGLLTRTTNLPDNTVQMTWVVTLGSANDDAGPTAIAFGGALTAWNY